MCLEEEQMIGRIMDTDTRGNAYVTGETGNREEYTVALTVENLANLNGRKRTGVRQIIVTDVMDRQVVDTRLGDTG